MSNELAVVETSNFLAIQNDPAMIGELLRENLGEGESLTVGDMERVGMPGGGGISWEVTGEDGQPTSESKIEGVVIAVGTRRAYWKTSFEQDPGSMPSCTSKDGIYGLGEVASAIVGEGQSLECSKCPKNQWGSVAGEEFFSADKDNKNGKACQERRLLFVLRQGDVLPIIVDLSPASIAIWKKFAVGQAMKGRAMHTLVVSLGLTKSPGGGAKGNIEYSVVNPKVVGKIDADAAEKIRVFADALKPFLNEIPAVQPVTVEGERPQEQPSSPQPTKSDPKQSPPKAAKSDPGMQEV